MAEKMNWSQARKKIDSGKTHDKVDHPDPAAAPLGTDEEAGGATTPADEIRKSVGRRERTSSRRPETNDKT